MGKKSKPLSLVSLMTADFLSLYLIIFLPVVLIYFVITGLASRGGGSEGRIIFTLILLWLPFFLWRAYSFKSLIARGVEVQGKITRKSSLIRAAYQIRFSYSFQKEKYGCTNILRGSEGLENLNVGDNVAVIVDRKNPEKAFLRDI